MKDRKLLNIELGRISPEEYRSLPESGLVVVLDNIRSAHNVGSAFRTADAFKADKVWLCGICAVPPSAEIHKSALGAEDSVPWEHVSDTLEAVAKLKAAGYTVIAVEQTVHSVGLDAFRPEPGGRSGAPLCRSLRKRSRRRPPGRRRHLGPCPGDSPGRDQAFPQRQRRSRCRPLALLLPKAAVVEV